MADQTSTKNSLAQAAGETADAATAAQAQADVPAGLTRREFISGMAAGATTMAVAGVMAPAQSHAAGPPARVFRIHPAIGIARLGNLDPDRAFIVGPELPGQKATEGLTEREVGSYKLDGAIKPQAVRFRVFEYLRNAEGRLEPAGEVLPQVPTPGSPYVKAITWTVHLANRKAAFYEEDGPRGETLPAGELRNPALADRASLQSDFGPRSIAGLSAAPNLFTPATAGGYPALRVVKDAYGLTLIDYLGQVRTDAEGRLLVFGGKGHSASSISPAQPLTHWSNNNYWFDDVGDGPVTAVVTVDDGAGNLTHFPMDAAGNAWVLVAPPDFSPGLNAGVSLYDVLYDMGVRKLAIPADNALYFNGGPLARMTQLNTAWSAWKSGAVAGKFEFGSIAADFASEVWPIIRNAVNLVYTTALVNFKHSAMLTDPLGDPSDSAAKARKVFFSYLRAPEDAATSTNGPATMPRLYGDNWYVGNENFVYTFGQNGSGNQGGGAVQTTGPRSVPRYQRYSTLTPVQYALLRSWAAGNFVPMFGTPPPVSVITPHGLDQANLENCIGGPFYPGIEAGWQIRNPALFIEPFRLNLAATSQFRLPSGQLEGTPLVAGHFSRQMALPWQADFNDCSKLLNLGWWPTARPDDVFLHATDKLSQRLPWARPDSKWPSGSSDTSYDDMLGNWFKFGFVLESEPGSQVYIEQERNPQVP
ncbi:MAG: LodA/GoxA family CTQ-dependent oxidase [Rhodocyclaceae bacterium]|nr:LodA/GoxA family CTQ-dependent oxidase [Rhodocyclaceae bacterium]